MDWQGCVAVLVLRDQVENTRTKFQDSESAKNCQNLVKFEYELEYEVDCSHNQASDNILKGTNSSNTGSHCHWLMTIADCLQMDQLWLQHWYQVVSYTNSHMRPI